MPDQIPMNLRPTAPQTFDNFHVAPSNTDALAMLKARAAWPSAALLLLGPEGSGKTHLGMAWAHATGGVFFDDASRADEAELFGAINQALSGAVSGVLLSDRHAPADWGVQFPDLLSRLNAMPVVRLGEHSDDTLEPILRGLFERTGRSVTADVVDFILRNSDRSVSALRALVEDLDVAAGSTKADMTKSFVSRQLKARSELDLFSGPIE